VKTNVLTAVRVTGGTEADGPELPALLATTAKRFKMAEVSADKAYLSHANLAAIEGVGAKPFIPFKLNSRAEGSEPWRKMHCLYTLNKEEFLHCYHKRSNVESAFFMIKKKFGSAVRARLEAAQFNEVLCKALCHNLSVLVHSFHELGVDAKFWLPSARVRIAEPVQ
jgi:transposase